SAPGGVMSVTYTEKPWTKKYDPGVPDSIEVPDHPLHDFLTRAARDYPEQAAMLFKGSQNLYRLLDGLSEALVAGLRANRYQKDDRAVIYMPNTPQFVITYYGILKAGGIVVATNPLYSERELEHQLANCGAETVFVLSLFYKKLKHVQKQGRTNVRRVIVSNIKEYLPPHLKFLFTIAKEKKEGHRVTLEAGDTWFQDFLA